MRDESTLPVIDYVLLTAMRSLTAKKPTFHDTGHRARDLRALRKDPPSEFNLKRVVKTSELFSHAIKVASPRLRKTLPDMSLHEVNDALARLKADGWIVPTGHDAFLYTHQQTTN